MIQEVLTDGLLPGSRGIIPCGRAAGRSHYGCTCAALMDIISTGDPFKKNLLELEELARSILLSGRHPASIIML